jgi:RNA polymerase sigma-70 factor (ECF subfamily)
MSAFTDLISRAANGDEEAFRRLWTEMNPRLVRYLRVLTRGRDVEDLASSTWLDVFRSLGTFEGEEPQFRAWLVTIARHRHIDAIRYATRRPVGVELGNVDPSRSELGPGDLVAIASGTEHALDLIATLPADQAEAVTLRVIADLDVATVARIMDRSEGSVRVLSHRGLRRLKDLVEDHGTDR